MAAGDRLSDAGWRIWEGVFPPEYGRVGQPGKVLTRLFLDALLWMTSEGARWHALPECFGLWNTVWRRFARWRDQDVFDVAFAAMSGSGLAKERLQMLNSTVSQADLSQHRRLRCRLPVRGNICFEPSYLPPLGRHWRLPCEPRNFSGEATADFCGFALTQPAAHLRHNHLVKT